MNKKRLQRLTFCLLILLTSSVISACGLLNRPAPAGTITPTGPAASPSQQATALSPAETGAAKTATLAPVITATTGEGEKSAATLAPAPRVQTGDLKGSPASVRKLGNLRAAPGTDAEILAYLDPGTPLGILGVTEKLTWALVDAPGGLQGWIYFGNLDLGVDQKDIPRVEPTPIP